MKCRVIFGFWMAIAGAGVWAQTPVEVAEWVEERSPSTPAYSTDLLIPVEMPPYVTLKVGIDPATLAVGATDGIVRYVVVMRNASGSRNVAYEGIRCATGEVKTYARVNAADQWVNNEQAPWKDMTSNLPSRHAYAIAKQGACEGRTAAKRDDIVTALKRRQVARD
jgi:hypothetical protein